MTEPNEAMMKFGGEDYETLMRVLRGGIDKDRDPTCQKCGWSFGYHTMLACPKYE